MSLKLGITVGNCVCKENFIIGILKLIVETEAIVGYTKED